MRLIEWMKGLFGPRHTVESVALELAEGLRNGTIYLDHLGPESAQSHSEATPSGENVPGTALNGVNGQQPLPQSGQIASKSES